MEKKVICVLAIALVLGLSSSAKGQAPFTEAQCQIQPKFRINCGPPSISAQACYDKGCCFDSDKTGVIWCYYPSPEAECVL
ncbi:putative gastrointestinal growth factor xP1 [Microcaecilia unicolor]|uniref:Gastrointestinal growth factor xP1 n=1 Tax=Microcaecilia unicolor TaxID=1415580 RepID=A0A6P7YCN5_9AMPH|nr:putative gastrointestinal growth factor xP1 [Microcaecilia unicolor]